MKLYWNVVRTGTSSAEGSHSGLVRPPAKRVGGVEPPRGFESRTLRHFLRVAQGAAFSSGRRRMIWSRIEIYPPFDPSRRREPEQALGVVGRHAIKGAAPLEKT